MPRQMKGERSKPCIVFGLDEMKSSSKYEAPTRKSHFRFNEWKCEWIQRTKTLHLTLLFCLEWKLHCRNSFACRVHPLASSYNQNSIRRKTQMNFLTANSQMTKPMTMLQQQKEGAATITKNTIVRTTSTTNENKQRQNYANVKSYCSIAT